MAGIADPPDRPEHGRAAGPAARRDPSRRDDAGDARLVQRIVSGDSTALGELYDRFGRQAYSLARRICADEGLAEDVVQEVFLAFWRDPSRFDPAKGRFGTWLLTLVHHKSVDAVRRESAIRRRTVPASEDGSEWNAPPGPGADEGAIGALVAGHVRDALDQLPADQRKVLALAYYGGYTQREVAAMTGVPLGTVKSRMFTGVAKLRNLLGPVVGDAGADLAGGLS
ncbi:RNA polymerase sigma-70 factor [Pseudonocardia sp. Ae406_Ps2]|uniref:RNA polymerase sigma factor n=1 Tax=unclassified Pseudonocardia TaxID=2619320 RepID=UPI0006CB3BB1|nr:MULTISPECIES: sigma-70 family RNA polymerase sigma factor [unclassified Pseudonocardia]ALE83285.1 RNA polymerase subunit sigma-24 [Pseudonocardia sp. HH130629-09]OLM01630.1 RNA polymerase sigma-70 factor [Pseudonocardia sp. Ae406_Ps2]OLM06591.1 RNA polymerase sigma-70 factor [Pseudonocardia sp. Ae331_Ps2]OLM13326.1 RNA polymerase sigma-70 factor [Pseudonocardia sp. Ae505_Ps2]OLM23201.1 RNA polymerase sigma-70 factor [Pseudonocardia sp. Ae706_Ps2]